MISLLYILIFKYSTKELLDKPKSCKVFPAGLFFLYNRIFTDIILGILLMDKKQR